MVAKASSISHGSVSINYITRMGMADIVRRNCLPENIEVEAIWSHMQLHRLEFQHMRSSYKALKNDTIRIEISPSVEETAGWTMADWDRLVQDFVKAFDAIDMRSKTGLPQSKSTTLANSQYVVTLHRDSKSGIPHLHLDGNRIDMDGHLIDDHMIGLRAVAAAREINRQRGWEQPEERSVGNKAQITSDCLNVLCQMNRFSWDEYVSLLSSKGYDIQLKRDSHNVVRGYTVRKGNSIYKSSEIGNSRNLMPSRIEATWTRLHPILLSSVPDQPQISRSMGPTFRQQTSTYHESIRTGYSVYNIDIPYSVYNVLKDKTDSLEQTSTPRTDALRIGMLLFAGYLDGATSMAESCGGGGSPTSGWGKDKDEDELEWARRCAREAHRMLHSPAPRRSRRR